MVDEKLIQETHAVLGGWIPTLSEATSLPGVAMAPAEPKVANLLPGANAFSLFFIHVYGSITLE
jgi:hypothetical protein